MTEQNERIVVVGAGNLAWSLIPAFQKAGVEVIQLISRNEEQRNLYANAYRIPSRAQSIDEISSEATMVFLAVNDAGIQEVASQIPSPLPPGCAVVHCSGSTPIDVLNSFKPMSGVFYPLQIFTRQKAISFEHLPIFIEGEGEIADRLQSLAKGMSDSVHLLASADRQYLHLGAVIACNFSNFLFTWAQKMVRERGLEFQVFGPLLEEQLSKALEFGPDQTQTGPAIRGDVGTIQRHLSLLADDPVAQERYLRLSLAINPRMKSELEER